MTRKQEDKYITQLVEEIQKIINKKGLSKIDPISSFRSTALQALESFEYKNRKKGSIRTLRGGSTGLVQQKRRK